MEVPRRVSCLLLLLLLWGVRVETEERDRYFGDRQLDHYRDRERDGGRKRDSGDK